MAKVLRGEGEGPAPAFVRSASQAAADAALARGENAAVCGDLRAAAGLARPPPCLRADPRPAHWAAAHAALDDQGGVAWLLSVLREAGAGELAARLPAAGMFRLFLEPEGRADQFRFGREPDGTPAAPWDWDDLD